MYNCNTPECYVFGQDNNALTAAMMNNGNNSWNNPIWALAFLAFLGRSGFGWDGNGGNGSHACTSAQLSQIQDTLNTNQGNTLLMTAISGNATSIKELANAINCNHNAVQAAINGVQSAICSVGNQVGMQSAQVINAINNGNMQLANTLQSCCCDVKQLVTTQGYENRIANLQQSQLIQNGFSQVGYASAEQTCAIKQSINDQTLAVLNKLDAQEDARKDREIATLTAQLATVNARAERQAELAPIVQKLNDIACKQPQTVTLPYSCATAVPTSMLYGAGLFGAGAIAAGAFGAGIGGIGGGIFG